MQPILSVSEMQGVDAAAETPVDMLMESAGNAVALSAARMGAGYGSVVRVLAGKGNNGGDGYVAAKYLARRGAAVTVHQLEAPDPASPVGAKARAAVAAGVRLAPLAEPEPCDLLIDALFGTGFAGALPEAVLPWVEGFRVLSVDVPSGMSGDTGQAGGPAFSAERTATFHMLKTGHILGDGPERCGVIDLYDIGLVDGRPAMYRFTADDVQLPDRPRRGHKWSVGAVATIGGVPGLTGAAVLVARAALRTGAGVSTIMTTAATAATYETVAPDLVTIQASETASWRDHASEVLALLDRYHTLVIGPGLEPVSSVFVDRVVERFEGNLIVDAGALNALSNLDPVVKRQYPTVLTPHGGEFARLATEAPTPDAAMWLAEATGATVVLKGNPTFVAGERLIVVDSGGPELASIGTGDVLAGMIAALLAAGVETTMAAASAAYLHGVAGRRLAQRTSVTAPSLIEEIGVLVADRRMGRRWMG